MIGTLAMNSIRPEILNNSYNTLFTVHNHVHFVFANHNINRPDLLYVENPFRYGEISVVINFFFPIAGSTCISNIIKYMILLTKPQVMSYFFDVRLCMRKSQCY